MQYVMPRTFYQSCRGGHHISGMVTLNLTMPEGRFRAAPISMEFLVGSMPMQSQIGKRCMPQLLRWQPLRVQMKQVSTQSSANRWPTEEQWNDCLAGN